MDTVVNEAKTLIFSDAIAGTLGEDVDGRKPDNNVIDANWLVTNGAWEYGDNGMIAGSANNEIQVDFKSLNVFGEVDIFITEEGVQRVGIAENGGLNNESWRVSVIGDGNGTNTATLTLVKRKANANEGVGVSGASFKIPDNGIVTLKFLHKAGNDGLSAWVFDRGVDGVSDTGSSGALTNAAIGFRPLSSVDDGASEIKSVKLWEVL